MNGRVESSPEIRTRHFLCALLGLALLIVLGCEAESVGTEPVVEQATRTSTPQTVVEKAPRPLRPVPVVRKTTQAVSAEPRIEPSLQAAAPLAPETEPAARPQSSKVEICHGVPAAKQRTTYKTLEIDSTDAEDHLAHGDSLGACAEICAAGVLCDDGNACTTDIGTWRPARGNGERGECGCSYQSVVCDDNNECTADSCNPASGCVFASEPQGTPCGGVPQGGQCDAQDTCDGQGACVDRVQPATTVCTGASQGGDCDDDAGDRCSGTNTTCVDAFEPATEVCRPSAGDCDVAEMCSGSGAACPVDAFKLTTEVCRSAAGDCDAVEMCSGSSADCGTDLFLPDSHVCRPVSGECDLADECSGSSADCGTDFVMSQGTSCSTGVCDGIEPTCCTPMSCMPGDCGAQTDGCGGPVDCGVCLGEACGTGALCAAGLCGCGDPADAPECADGTTCQTRTGWNCRFDSDCATGFCECLGGGTGEANDPCDSAGGSCRVPLGGDCTTDSDCFARGEGGSCSPDNECIEKRLPLGAACTPMCDTDTDVAYLQWQDCPGGVWVDPACRTFDSSTRAGLLGLPIEETYCFKNSLTPGNCSNAINTLCESDADCADLAEGTCNYGGPVPGTRCNDNNYPPTACTVDSDCPQPGSAVSVYCIDGMCGCPDPLCDADNLCNEDDDGNTLGYRCNDPENPNITVPCVCASQCMKGPMAPGQPTCCLGPGQQCQDDSDCCQGNHLEPNLATSCDGLSDGTPCAARDGEFLGICRDGASGKTCVPVAELRTRHCIDDGGAFGKICKKWALPGEPCDVDGDCLGGGTGITCKNTCQNTVFQNCTTDFECPQGESCRNGLCSGPLNNVCDTSATCPGTETCTGPKVCSPPLEAVIVGEGGVCYPNDSDFVCASGLSCMDCKYAGKGWRCLDPTDGCCNDGGVDSTLCGDFATGNQCCGWQCTTRSDPTNCGICGNDCTAVPPDEIGCWNPSDTCTVDLDGNYGCNFVSQCDPGEVCLGEGVVTTDCQEGTLSPNALADICCYTPVAAEIQCTDEANCLRVFSGVPEGEFPEDGIRLTARAVCSSNADCEPYQYCERDSDRTLWIFQSGTGEDNLGVCVWR